MAPVVHGLEAKYHEQMVFSFLDIDDDDNETFKRTLGYRYQPHLFLLDAEGIIIKQWLGYVSGEELEAAFLEVLDE
jgi:hypothetical protein